MIDISIVGIRDGNHPFAMTVRASDIPGLSSEFTHDVVVEGLMQKHVGGRYTVFATAAATARLICDRSLEEYDEPLEASFELEYRVDTALAAEQRGRIAELDDEEVRGLRDDDKAIDITEDVRQVLTLAIPARRVAPAYRDKNLDEIFPSIKGRDAEQPSNDVDDRWEALKNIHRT
jgi:uncharacterized metal-binding protein YceD (DUF177 family)